MDNLLTKLCLDNFANQKEVECFKSKGYTYVKPDGNNLLLMYLAQ